MAEAVRRGSGRCHRAGERGQRGRGVACRRHGPRRRPPAGEAPVRLPAGARPGSAAEPGGRVAEPGAAAGAAPAASFRRPRTMADPGGGRAARRTPSRPASGRLRDEPMRCGPAQPAEPHFDDEPPWDDEPEPDFEPAEPAPLPGRAESASQPARPHRRRRARPARCRRRVAGQARAGPPPQAGADGAGRAAAGGAPG